ncbi:hypothetical protein V2J09_003914 [Rumex salicifolius]
MGLLCLQCRPLLALQTPMLELHRSTETTSDLSLIRFEIAAGTTLLTYVGFTVACDLEPLRVAAALHKKQLYSRMKRCSSRLTRRKIQT